MRSSGPARRSASSAPTKTATPSKSTSSSNVPAKTQAAAPAKPAPSSTPATGQQRGSLMRDIGTSAAGSLVGVMGAHAIMNAFSGTDKQAEVEQLVAADPMFGPCNPQYQGFLSNCIV